MAGHGMERKTQKHTSWPLRAHLGSVAVLVAALFFNAIPAAASAFHQQPLLAADTGSVFGEDIHSSADATVATPFDDSFRALVADTLAAWHVPGVAVAVLDGDSTWAEGFGIAALPDSPVTADTLFYTASTTKAFVAGALSLMVESGNYTVAGRAAAAGEMEPGRLPRTRLDWSTPLADILPDDFVLGDDPWATAHLTLEDALAHRTGLAAHDLSRSRRYGLDPESAGRNASVRDVTRSLRHLPLHTSPRTEWRYCNLMFLVLAHAVETLAGGRWLGDVLREWLWAPLGMESTFFSLDDARAAPAPAALAQGYYWAAAAEAYVAVPHMPLEEVSGAGGIISSVNDYARWLRCWIDGPAFASPSAASTACGGIPFTHAGLDAVLAPKIFLSRTAASPEPFDMPTAYASAWTTSSYRGHRFWGHSGGSNAFGAQVYFFPDDRFGVVLFGNTASTSNAAELVLLWHLADERFGTPKDQRYDWEGRFRRAAARRTARVDGAMDRLYPDRTQPPQPPILPLAAYEGTYHHPAYQNMTVRLARDADDADGMRNSKNYNVTFIAERPDHTWPTLCEFVHASGEHWLLYTDMLYERSGNFKSYGRASFDVGADGRAHALVVEFWNADDDSVEGVIPFQRLLDDLGGQ